jgi:hypothetical protein
LGGGQKAGQEYNSKHNLMNDNKINPEFKEKDRKYT